MFGSKNFNTLVLVALCLLLTPFWGYGQASASSPFDDVSDSHWALPHIIKMELREIITGYGDGTFKPENPVSQLEATTMAVRAMGLDKEAREVRDTSRAEPFDLPTTWNAAGYVTIALKEEVIDSSNFQASENASRAWVAQLVIRMIDTREEPDSIETHFDDDNEIPFWARRYVALSVDKEIITGIRNQAGGYDFQPRGNVTRAQLATMISRSDRYMQEVEGQLPVAEVISREANKLSLTHLDDTSRELYVSVNAVVFDSSYSEISHENIAEGSLIRYHTDGQDIITFAELLNRKHYTTDPGEDIEEEEETEELEGTVIQHFGDRQVITIEDGEGDLVTYSYCPDLDVDFQQGDVVTLTIKGSTIVEAEVESPAETDMVEGVIFSLDTEGQGILTLESNDRYQSYSLAEEVEVEYLGKRFPTIEDLQEGDRVRIGLEDGTIKNITLLALEDDALTGKIITISQQDRILTIRTQDTRLLAYQVCSQADIDIRGISSPSISDLEKEDDINFRLEGDIITGIEVISREYESEITGEVLVISPSSRIIAIEDQEGNYKTYKIDDYVYLDLDMRSPRLGDIYEGMPVTLKLDKNIVHEISIFNTIEGEIEQIDENRNTIVVKHERGRKTCRLEEASIRIVDVSRADIGDLEEGQKVLVTLDEDIVDRVEVITEKIVSIEEINTSRERLEVREGTSTYSYRASSDTTYNIPGISSPEFEDLAAGDMVILEFVGTTLQKVTVTPHDYGIVISTSETQDRLSVEIDGSSESYRVDDEMTAYSSSNKEMSPYNLKSNDYVKIVQAEDRITLYQAEKVQGKISSANIPDNRISIMDTGGRYQYYNTSEELAVWKNSSDYPPRDLKIDAEVTLYLFDSVVTGIEVK